MTNTTRARTIKQMTERKMTKIQVRMGLAQVRLNVCANNTGRDLQQDPAASRRTGKGRVKAFLQDVSVGGVMAIRSVAAPVRTARWPESATTEEWLVFRIRKPTFRALTVGDLRQPTATLAIYQYVGGMDGVIDANLVTVGDAALRYWTVG